MLLLAVGSLVNAYAGKLLLKYWDDFLGRIPFVKTLVRRLSRRGESACPRAAARSATCSASCSRVSQMCTRSASSRARMLRAVLDAHGGHGLVTVYFPMSYAFGGYTVYLPRELLQPLDISVEDAMRLAITAGLTASTRARIP